MSGCYGNSPEDRYFERMLDRWLDEQDEDEDEDGLTLAQRKRIAKEDAQADEIAERHYDMLLGDLP